MKNLILLSYYWPPAGGPGVQRFLKFCKYLPEFGWNPIVISPENGSYPYYDQSLLKDIPKGIRVIQTKTREPYAWYNRLQGKKSKSVAIGSGTEKEKSLFQQAAAYIRANFFLPDARVGWNRFAIAAAEKLIQEEKIDALISTGPPHSTHLAALTLMQKYHLPWLADFRDPWTSAYFIKSLPRTKRSREKDIAFERSVLEQATAVSTVSAGLKKEFENRSDKVHLIYNGYDEEDVPQKSEVTTDKFTLEYIGNFKPNQNVKTLWTILAELCSESTEFASDFQLILTGQIPPSVRSAIEATGLSPWFSGRDFVPHTEATRFMQQAGMLLFIIPNSPGNELIITGKIFEYLAVGNDILSIGPKHGEAARILTDCGRKEMLDYQEGVQMKEQILQSYHAWKNKQKTHIDQSGILKYSRRSMSKQLADVLNSISRTHE